MRLRLFAALSLFIFVSIASAQTPFTFNEMIASKRVGDPQISPDGRAIAYSVGVVNKDANKTVTQIYTMSPDGSNQKKLTSGESSSSSPRWSPDGKQVAYVSGGQVWRMKPDGDDKKQVSNISTGAGNPVWSPDGKWIAFGSDVYPECTSDDCNKAEDARIENSKVQAKVTDRLLYRHWVEWRDRKRSHVFVVPSDGGVAADFTPGDFDSPPYAASTGTDYAFSPDSKEIAFLKNPDKIEAISTNSDIVIASLFDKTQKNITAANKGYDAAPIYTPDGKYIIYRSQATATFEADRWRIMRYNRQSGESVELTRGFDLQADEAAISPDGKTIYFAAGERGYSPIFSVPVEPDFRLRSATFVKPVVKGIAAGSLNISPDGRSIVFVSSSAAMPAEIMSVNTDGSGLSDLTKANTEAYARYGLQKVESIEWTGGANARVQGFILKPANFDPSKKYPLMVLIHGGPQGAWSDNWGYRWNPQIFANAGYVVFMPNQRGSTGFGQQFVNDVSADWGGRAFADVMNGVADVSKRPYIDATRIGAAGASYGGYMVDWILGHNNDRRFKFKTLVSHAGVYNLESMAGATEELWFVNWEFKGMPWQNPLNYQRWSPNKFAKNFSTPTLVSAGELDYRVPVDQSLQLFTALQLNNVDSKLIIFPDEGHWILKPQNSEFWYRNVLEWLDKHLKN
ncbi:MAG TPA: S9 family peptidase [Pyrinomonadaceae bacterium]|nr:S9 family peptidase [Pyrinomonadaceae bacterium]